MPKKPKASDTTAEPKHGSAPGGESINPMGLPEESSTFGTEPETNAAPAPGVPISDEEFRRMKEAVEHLPTPPVENAQEDRGAEKGRRQRGSG